MNLSIYMMYIFSYCYFFGFVGRSWSFLAWFLPRFPLFFSRLSRVFCRGFFWPPSVQSVSCRCVSKTPLIFLDVFCDVFLTILFFRLSWSSIKRSALLRHNKPEMLLVVICVLLGSLLLRTEPTFHFGNQSNLHIC